MAQMKHLVVHFFALLLVPSTFAKSVAVQYCNKKADYAVKVSGLEVDPYPISRGKETNFKIDASTNQVISGGKLKVDVSYFGFHVHSEDHDLCKGTRCPVSVGDFVVSNTEELPGITPPGNYNIKMTMLDGNKKQLTCIIFAFSIGFVDRENLADS